MTWPVTIGGLTSVVLTVFAVMQLNGYDRPLAWILVAAATAMGVRPARLPQLGAAVTPIHFFILIALLEFGPLLAIATAAAGVTGAALVPERPMRPVQYLVNVLAMLTATLAALLAGQQLVCDLPPPADRLLHFATVAALAFAIVNTAIVALAISRSRGRPFLSTWWMAISCDAWSHPAGLLITVGVLRFVDAFALIVLSAIATIVWTLVRVFRHRSELADALD